MPIPKYHELMLPLLKLFTDGIEHQRYEFVDVLSDQFNLSQDERSEQVTNRLTRIADRVGWATSYLKNAGFLESTRRGYHRITPRGVEVLGMNLVSLNKSKILELYPELNNNLFFNSFLDKKKNKEIYEIEEKESPEDIINFATNQKKLELYDQISDQINELSPTKFEKLVVELVVNMGYGTKEKSWVTKRTRDGGIDGVVQADELGLEKVFIQAKKYTSNVGEPDLRDFVGALSQTKKGVFITTSDFSRDAREYINNRIENIVLIDGKKLVELMYKFNLGVSVRQIIEIKGLDGDYFEELN